MALFRFTQALPTGTISQDSITASTYGDVYYGLQANDNFNVPGGHNYIMLMGGTGADTYNLNSVTNPNAAIFIDDDGNSAGDTITATGIGLSRSTTSAYLIDGRHLWLTDSASGESFIVIDWTTAANQIETWNLSDGTYTYAQMQAAMAHVPSIAWPANLLP